MSNPTTTETPMFLIADADWLTPDLAVGGDLSADPTEAAAQARWLQRQGITDIIDCRQEYSDEELVADVCPAIRYHHLPTDDHGGELDPDWWYRGIAIAKLVAERGGSVFVHCHMGVNRGPSLALAILFDRSIDPLAAFDLLRARRPQAFAIYATQYLKLEGRYEDAKVLQTFMNLEANHDDLVAAIGRIRRAESGGRYRFPLSRAHDELAAPESVDDFEPEYRADPCPWCADIQELMEHYRGGPTTELPTAFVRSLIGQLEWSRADASDLKTRLENMKDFAEAAWQGISPTEFYHRRDKDQGEDGE